MENIKFCELCLNQIIKIEGVENLHCDEKQNLKILKNLDITVSKDAKICSNCVNVSHLTYNFKMSCLTNNNHLKTLIHPGIKDKLILEEVVVEETKSEFKNEKKVCRFCLNFSEVNSLVEVNLEQDVVLKDMLLRCLPEIDTNMVQNPLICSNCSKLLEKLFNFISQCKDTEVLRNLDTKTDVLVNENMPTVANNDDNIDNSFVKEENCECIKNPELQIKSEDFDIGEDIKDSISDGNCLLNEREIQVRMCSCTASTKHEIVRHKKDHKDRKRCLGNNVEEKDVKPKPHGTIKEKKFVCDICSHQATRLYSLKQHYLSHKKPWEVSLFKCDHCLFATKWKRCLTKHIMRHKNSSELPEFKCNDCPYETYNRANLFRHGLVHRTPSQVKIYKCKVCPFQAKYTSDIRVHEKQHQVEIYTCDKCNYKSKFKHSVMAHLRYHKGTQPAERYTIKIPIRVYQNNTKKM